MKDISLDDLERIAEEARYLANVRLAEIACDHQIWASLVEIRAKDEEWSGKDVPSGFDQFVDREWDALFDHQFLPALQAEFGQPDDGDSWPGSSDDYADFCFDFLAPMRDDFASELENWLAESGGADGDRAVTR